MRSDSLMSRTVSHVKRLRVCRVLYTSGRNLTDTMRARFVDNSSFLPKPYTSDGLLWSMRNLLSKAVKAALRPTYPLFRPASTNRRPRRYLIASNTSVMIVSAPMPAPAAFGCCLPRIVKEP